MRGKYVNAAGGESLCDSPPANIIADVNPRHRPRKRKGTEFITIIIIYLCSVEPTVASRRVKQFVIRL